MKAQAPSAQVLRRSKTMSPIPGTSSVGHLEENCHAALVKLSDADLEELSRLAS